MYGVDPFCCRVDESLTLWTAGNASYERVNEVEVQHGVVLAEGEGVI